MAKSSFDQDVADHALRKLTHEGGKYAGFDPQNADITHTQFLDRKKQGLPAGIYFFQGDDVVRHNGERVFITKEQYRLPSFELTCNQIGLLTENPLGASSWQYCCIVVKLNSGPIGSILVNEIDPARFSDFHGFEVSPLALFHYTKTLTDLLDTLGLYGWELVSHQKNDAPPETHYLTFKRSSRLPVDPPFDL